MKTKNVNPDKWYWDAEYPIRILYDNDDYSVIWGKYKNNPCLAARWNGWKKERGFPGQGSHPTYYVEPDFLAPSILGKLLDLAINNDTNANKENIIFAMNELANKQVT